MTDPAPQPEPLGDLSSWEAFRASIDPIIQKEIKRKEEANNWRGIGGFQYRKPRDAKKKDNDEI